MRLKDSTWVAAMSVAAVTLSFACSDGSTEKSANRSSALAGEDADAGCTDESDDQLAPDLSVATALTSSDVTEPDDAGSGGGCEEMAEGEELGDDEESCDLDDDAGTTPACDAGVIPSGEDSSAYAANGYAANTAATCMDEPKKRGKKKKKEPPPPPPPDKLCKTFAFVNDAARQCRHPPLPSPPPPDWKTREPAYGPPRNYPPPTCIYDKNQTSAICTTNTPDGRINLKCFRHSPGGKGPAGSVDPAANCEFHCFLSGN